MAEVAVRVSVSGTAETGAALSQVGQQATNASRTISRSAIDARRNFTGLTSALRIGASAAEQFGIINAETANKVFRVTTALQGAVGMVGLLRGAYTVVTAATTAQTAATAAQTTATVVQTAAVGGLRLAIQALLGPVGLIIAAATLLALGIKVLIDRKREAKEAAERLEQAHRDLEGAITSVTAATSNAVSTYGAYNERIAEAIRLGFRYAVVNYEIQLSLQGLLGASKENLLSMESIDKARRRLIDQSITFIDVDKEAAEASKKASEAARERLEAETLLMDVLDEQRIAGEVMQVAVPRAQVLAAAIKGLAFDARDAAANLRELTDEVVDLTDAIQRGQLEAQRVKGLVFDARDISGNAAAAERVITETIRRLTSEAQTLIGQAQEVSQAVGPEIAMMMLENAIPAFEKLGVEGNEAIRLILEALSELGKQIPEFVVPAVRETTEEVNSLTKSLQTTIASTLSGIIQGTQTFGDLWKAIWSTLVNHIIQEILKIETVKKIVTGIGSFFGGFFGFLGKLFGFQRGGDFVVNRPTPIMVGEAGAERVSVRPLAAGMAMAGAGGGGGTIVLQGPMFWDEITKERFFREVRRRLGR